MSSSKTGTGKGSPGLRRGRRGANTSKGRGATKQPAKPRKLKPASVRRIKTLVAGFIEDSEMVKESAKLIDADRLRIELQQIAWLEERVLDGTINSEENPVITRASNSIQKLLEAHGVYVLNDPEEDGPL